MSNVQVLNTRFQRKSEGKEKNYMVGFIPVLALEMGLIMGKANKYTYSIHWFKEKYFFDRTGPLLMEKVFGQSMYRSCGRGWGHTYCTSITESKYACQNLATTRSPLSLPPFQLQRWTQRSETLNKWSLPPCLKETHNLTMPFTCWLVAAHSSVCFHMARGEKSVDLWDRVGWGSGPATVKAFLCLTGR